MKDDNKSKKQLLEELVSLRRQIAELKTLEAARKQAEDKLWESDARYRFISENIADVIWVLSPKTGKFTYVSASVQKLSGYTPEEVLNQTLAEALTPAALQIVTPELQERLAERKPGDTSLYKFINLLDLPCKDGSMISTEIAATVVFDEQGQPAEIIGVTRDITERKRAEAALQESEERYRTLFESANYSIFLVRQEQIIECNPATEQIFGRPRGDLIGISPVDLSPSRQPDGQDSATKVREKINSVLAGIPQHFEWVHSRPDGTLFDAEVSLNRIQLNGEWLILTSIRDTTRRKQAEEALRQYTERLQILHEIDRGILTARSPEAIAQAAFGRFRQLIPCQRAAVTLFDFTTNEAIILAVAVDTESEMKAGYRFPLEQLEAVITSLRQGQVTTFGDLQSTYQIFQTLYAEGLRAHTVVPLISQGKLIGSLNLSHETLGTFTQEHEAIARQVADQLAIAIQQARFREQIQRHAAVLEQRVTKRTAELEQQYHRQAVLEERQRLARDLHDSVTQTLFSMTLTAEATRILLTRDPGRVPAQLDRLHELTQEALAEMRVLVHQLRSTTTERSGLVPALRQHVVERQAQDGLQVTLNVTGEKQLPPEYEDALFRIVQEGLNNIIKHAQTKQAEVTLHLTDEAVILLIEDDGVGFDPSTTLGTGPSTTLVTDEVHFGLATMRERAKMLDGSFTVEARSDTGTRIKVEIPLTQEGREYAQPE